MKIACIDIGTNTVLLLIAEISDAPSPFIPLPLKGERGRSLKAQSFTALHDEALVARLGEGVHASGVLSPKACTRALAVLEKYTATCNRLACDKVIAVGTAALRLARNANDFVQTVQNRLGIAIEIISGEEEARLINLSATQDFSHLQGRILVLDIGGGSTEFIVGSRGQSLPLGTVTLTESFLKTDPPTHAEIMALKKAVQNEIGKAFAKSQEKIDHLIATAGTPTTLSALIKGLKSYEAKIVHGSRLRKEEILTMLKKLQEMPLKERSRLPCLELKRADVIVAGAHILLTVMEHFHLSKVWVSDRGLRFGVLLSFLHNKTAKS